MAQIEEMGRSRAWKDPEELLPAPLRSDAAKAIDFLDAVRCFLHYRQGRDLKWIDLRIAIGGCVRRNRAPGRPHDFTQ